MRFWERMLPCDQIKHSCSAIGADAGVPVTVIALVGIAAFVVGAITVLAPLHMQVIVRAGIASSVVHYRCRIQPPWIGVIETIMTVFVTFSAMLVPLAMPASIISARPAFLTSCASVSTVGTAFRTPCAAL